MHKVMIFREDKNVCFEDIERLVESYRKHPEDQSYYMQWNSFKHDLFASRDKFLMLSVTGTDHFEGHDTPDGAHWKVVCVRGNTAGLRL